MADQREEILKRVFEAYIKANPKDNWLRFDEVKSCGTAEIVFAAMDENGKRMCLDLLVYMAKNEYKCFWMEDDDGDPYYLFSKGSGYQNLTKEELFENFL